MQGPTFVLLSLSLVATTLLQLPDAFAESRSLVEPALPGLRRINGRVVARGRRTPLANAAVLLRDDTWLTDTDEAGAFHADVPNTEGLIEIFAAGFERESIFLHEVPEGEFVIVRLMPTSGEGLVTTVKALAVQREGPSVVSSAKELRETPGSLGDPVRAAMKAPGVGSVMSAVPYPVVRGTQPGATAVYFDGVRIPVLFHLLAGPSVVHPEFIDAIEFMSGNLPASFGRTTGGVIDVRTRAPTDELTRGSVAIDLLNASGFIERNFPETQTAVSLAGRLSYTGLLLAAMANLSEDGSDGANWKAGFRDYQLRVDQRVGDGSLRLFVFGSSDDVALVPRFESMSRPLVRVAFHRADLRYRNAWEGGGFEAAVTVATDLVGMWSELGGRPNGEASADETQVSARATVRHALMNRLDLEVGADVERRWGRFLLEGIVPDDVASHTADGLSAPSSVGTFAGTFARVRWTPVKRWTLVPGVRVDAYHLSPDRTLFAVEPRLGTSVGLGGAWRLTGSVGVAHQPPSVTLPLPVMAVSGLRYGLQRSLQTSVGVSWREKSGWLLSANTYVDQLERTVEFDVWDVVNARRKGTLPEESDPASSGRAWGVIFNTSRQTDTWSVKASYAYQQSSRLTTFAAYDGHGVQTDTLTQYLPFAFERRHALHLGGTRRWANGWSLGGTMSMASGRPESGVLTSRTRRPQRTEDERWAWTRVSLNEVDRLPMTFRLDARAAREWTFNDFRLEAYLDVHNLSFTNEVLGYDYRVGGEGPQNPDGPWRSPVIGSLVVLPMLGVKAVF